MMTFLLASLTIAAITYTFSHGDLFAPLRNWLAFRRAKGPVWMWGSTLLLCRYCLSHWVGALVAYFAGLTLLEYFPSVWVANHAMNAYAASNHWPQRAHAAIQADLARAEAVKKGLVSL